MAFSALLLLCSAVPVAAGKCIDKTRHRHAACPLKSRQVAIATAPVKRIVPPTTVVLKSPGGGSAHWMPIASDLMP